MPTISKAKWLHRAPFDLSTFLPGEQEARDALGLPNRSITQACFLYPGSSGWDDNDSITDASGNTHPALGKTGSCPVFTASGGILFSTGSPFTLQGSLTVSFWVYFDTIDATCELISGNTSADMLRTDASGNLLFIEPRSSGFVQATGALVTGQWYHIAMTYDGSTATGSTCATVKIYKNGTLNITGSSAGANWTNPYNNTNGTTIDAGAVYTSFRVGARGDGSLPLKGKMSQLYVYQSVLSDGNITSLAAHTIPAGAVFWLPMEERGGTVAYAAISGLFGAYSGAFTRATTADFANNAFRYGATVYLDGSTTNTYGIVPHNTLGNAISHASNKPFGGTNSNLVGDFSGGQMFEGPPNLVDWSDAAAGWSSGLGLETSYAFSTTRTTPRYSLNTESTLVKFCRAGTAKIVSYFGTSLTSGTGGDWATNTTAWLNDRTNSVTAFNDASSGQQSTWGLANIGTVTARTPKFCFLESFAMNDADILATTVTVAQHRSNVIGMIDAILAAEPTCVIYLMTMNPTTNTHASGNARHPNLSSYYEEDRDIVLGYAAASVKLLDFAANLWAPLSQADLDIAIDAAGVGVHPTQSASDTYIVPYIRSVLVGVTKNCYLFAAS